MNKQEVIEEIKNIKGLAVSDKTIDYREVMVPIGEVLNIINQLDEPEKPVVPQFVADWYESINYDFEHEVYDLCVKFHYSSERLSCEIKEWFNKSENKPIQTLVNMHQFGYEVEKEKLYTVKFVNEDFGTTYIGIFKRANKIGLSTLPMDNEYSKCYFTESELKELKFWDNPAFEIKEVKE